MTSYMQTLKTTRKALKNARRLDAILHIQTEESSSIITALTSMNNPRHRVVLMDERKVSEIGAGLVENTVHDGDLLVIDRQYGDMSDDTGLCVGIFKVLEHGGEVAIISNYSARDTDAFVGLLFDVGDIVSIRMS